MAYCMLSIFETFLDQREHYDGSIIYDEMVGNPTGTCVVCYLCDMY